nr:glycosyltransferase [Legionella jordanis]
MNILNVNISIDALSGGGTAERTYQMSRYLAKQNYKCTILTLTSNLTEKNYEELKNVNLIMLPYLSRRFYLPKGGLKRIRDAVREADVIHLMNHWTFLNAIVYLFARFYQKPYVVCPAGALNIFGRSRFIKQFFNRMIGTKIIQNAQGHIAIAENEFEQYRSYGVDKQQITLIPNGVVVEDFKPEQNRSSTLNLPPNYILFMGRLNYIKGPDLLLEAFAKLPEEYKNYHLVFAGPDEGMKASLENRAKELQLLNNVHFTGSVSGMDKIDAYRGASFLVVPSRKEAMSIVVAEAGVFAKPALITDQCGFDALEIIQGGYVVPATAESLAEGLVKIIKEPTKFQMGQNLKQFIIEHYTWDSVGKKIVRLYETLC